MTTSLKSLYSKSENNIALDMQFITSSTAYTAVRPGRYRITAIGGGGGGSTAAATTGVPGFAQGGCAGGLSQKTIALAAGNLLTIVIGAGGAAGNSANNGTYFNGKPGGATTVTGPGISLIANGGPGGLSTYGSTIVAAQTGGTASGGDINNTGGGQRARASASEAVAYGGASIGIVSDGYTPSGANGAGVGSAVGHSLLGTIAFNAGLGAGYNTAGSTLPATYQSILTAPSFFSLLSGTVSGTSSGMGTGGTYSYSWSTIVPPGLGGGGAFGSTQNGYNYTFYGYSSVVGGGGGGGSYALYYSGTATAAVAGAGGAGLVVIEFLG